jgi:GTP-binding protein
MFIDEARIKVKAGDGGNGCMAFRREKFVPRGGPSGGDGGHGGDILMRSSLSHNTLVHFRFNPEWKSERGGHGLGSNMSGSTGHPTVLQVPVGTLLYDDATGELLHDFATPNDEIVIARGGRGGRGNQHFATSTHQAPREHELGRSGEDRVYRLELRLLADAGLVGYPNVGKSTLISRLSAARPKIANYAFTTLEPNLGVVQVGDAPYTQSFTVADMPGLIEGASQGAGLGTQFLRHIERTSVLVHLVDVSDASLALSSFAEGGGSASSATARPDPVEDFKIITAELKAFDPALAAKPTILVAAKADVANPDKLKKLRDFARRRKLPFYEISAVTGQGIDKLKFAIAEAVAEHRPRTQAAAARTEAAAGDPSESALPGGVSPETLVIEKLAASARTTRAEPAIEKPARRKPAYPPPAPNSHGSRTR